MALSPQTARTPRALVLALPLLVGTIAPALAGDAPPPSRWMAPPGVERLPHEIWQPDGPFTAETGRVVRPAAAREGERIVLVVEADLEPVLAAALVQYQTDLARRGHASLVTLVEGGTPADLRAHLIQLHQEPEGLWGAVFVGNLPYIVYELVQNWDGDGGREYEDFPCDLYFMDMTGTWSDDGAGGTVPAGNGKIDHWVDSPNRIEIWVGRLRVDTLSQMGSPPVILNRYFARNHLYRTGGLVPQAPPARALVYVDDDWGYMVGGTGGDEWCLSRVYEEVTSVFDVGGNPGNNATAANYRTLHMPQAYQMVHLRSHGSPTAHGFYENSGAQFNYVYATQYQSIDPPAHFYSMFVCSGCDYTAQYGSSSNYLGGVAAFNETAGLAAWGSTKTGGMWNDDAFYTVLGAGGCLGDAFVAWFNDCHGGWPTLAPRWWYGMVLIGDAALVPNGDYFAPAAPTGLTAVAEEDGVALSWMLGPEPDLALHRVFRADGSLPREWIAAVEPPATTWWDADLLPGHAYTYWLTAVDALGNESTFSEPDTVTYGVLSAVTPARETAGLQFRAGPNPCAGRAAFHLGLPRPGRVALTIHDAAGRQVRSIVDRDVVAGDHVWTWDGRDDAGARLEAGIYFGRLRAPGEDPLTRTVLVVR